MPGGWDLDYFPLYPDNNNVVLVFSFFRQAAYVLGSPDQAHVILGCLPPPPRHNFYFS